MEINTSLDWNTKRLTLEKSIKALPPGKGPRDLRNILATIDRMVVELSKLEVEARRTKRPEILVPQIKKINDSLTTLEHWLMLGTLLS